MDVRYWGWSGVELVGDEVRIGFDLPEEAVDVWSEIEGPAALCVTHGHPDHCGLLTALEKRGDPRVRFDLIAPEAVVDRFRRLWHGAPARMRRADEGVDGGVGPTTIDRFHWDHLPLLPPGIGRAATFARHVLAHPLALMRIGWEALQLPLTSPMLGYVVEWPEGPTVVNYAEGLHGRTTDWQIARVAETYAPEVVIAAVEPEHTEALGEALEQLGPERVYVYEAHRPWREQFGLPVVDLEGYAGRLAESGSFAVEALNAGAEHGG